MSVTHSVLPPIRVLDLTEGGCMLGGRLLGDAGADVIAIEKPEGSSSRTGPYYHDSGDPQQSLVWFSFNVNKRGITLDIEHPEGQETFRRLAEGADIIMESFPPGYMNRLGIGYDDLCRIKPDIIYCAITPFGQQGPKSGYPASELTAWASSGYLNACGEPDEAPVWISVPQTNLFGGCEGAVGSLMAYYHRLTTGEGQFVDVSMQEAIVSPNMNSLPMWDTNGIDFKRVGSAIYVASTGVKQKIYFKCRDGYVMILAIGGNEPYLTSSSALVRWMDENGQAPDWLKRIDWATDFNASKLTQEMADRVGAAIESFTLTRTKEELYNIGAFEFGILIAPVSTTKDISEDLQLEARHFWTDVSHPELDGDIPYCGPFIRLSETPVTYRHRAPITGEHNREIYTGELGFSEVHLAELHNKGVI
jgi:crotonobetainyl-CoA:carnitine CoA-transferase CaiB-like acyl-CoA transferase